MVRGLVSLGLVLAVLHVGCGTGISLDPGSADPPHVAEDDGGKIQTVDAAEDGDRTDAEDTGASDTPLRDVDGATEAASRADGGDAGNADAGGPQDGAADRADTADRAGDATGDATRDLGSDDALDTAADVSFDVFIDAAIDSRTDSSFDVSSDPATDASDDAGDARRDAADGRRDATEDAARDADAVDAFDGCSAVSCWPDADYYVDSTAPPGGNGSKLQPFQTITAAIQAHNASPGVARKAYVAPGRYDEALGERFPLVLRGLSLEGAGQDRTSIVGAGRLDHGTEGGSIPSISTVTVVVGERQLPEQLFGLAVQSLSPVPVENYYGVFCDRGNATGEVASPLGLTHLDQVTVGPGYASDVVVATSTNPSSTGCNMLITRSTITYDDPVMLEMGTDDPASGNTISWMTTASGLAVGVTLQDCVIRGSFQYNTFRDSVIGASLADTGLVSPPNTRVDVSFKHNAFERCSVYGLLATGYTLFAGEISDNRFSNITRALNQTTVEAVAFSLDVFDVGKIRRNEFIGNDTAVKADFTTSPGTPADFGTIADPGNNVFRCNSGPQGSGGDVLIAGDRYDPELTWAGTLPLAGNAWDHVPPTFLTVDPPPNGVDISLLYAPHIDIDRGGATLSTVACPSGRVPGQ
jgi:Protein of unknown function (DUF1565)